MPIFTTESPGSCPGADWLSYGSYCYRVERIPRSYGEAKFDCSTKGFLKDIMCLKCFIISNFSKIGSNVVSLASKAEMEFVKNNVDSKPVIFETWIGLERNSTTGMIHPNLITSIL